MHLTAPGSTGSISGIWKSIRERFGSLRLSFPPWAHAMSFCSGYGGLAALSVHNAESMGDGWQRADG
jgi:hypothetical protein